MKTLQGFLIAKFCDSEFAYRGWHLYLDGKWVKRSSWVASEIQKLFGSPTPCVNAIEEGKRFNLFIEWFRAKFPNGRQLIETTSQS